MQFYFQHIKKKKKKKNYPKSWWNEAFCHLYTVAVFSNEQFYFSMYPRYFRKLGDKSYAIAKKSICFSFEGYKACNLIKWDKSDTKYCTSEYFYQSTL